MERRAWPPRKARRIMVIAWCLLGLPALAGGAFLLTRPGDVQRAAWFLLMWEALLTVMTVLVVVLMTRLARAGREGAPLPPPRRPRRARDALQVLQYVVLAVVAPVAVGATVWDWFPTWYVFMPVLFVAAALLIAFLQGTSHVGLQRVAHGQVWRLRTGTLEVPPRLRRACPPGLATVVAGGRVGRAVRGGPHHVRRRPPWTP